MGGTRIWDNPNRTGEPLLTTYGAHVIKFESASDVPGTIYAEGTETVTGGIKVLYYHPDTEALEDTVKVTGVVNNIKLEGLPDEKTIRQDGQTVRVEPYEFSTGAFLQVNTDRSEDRTRELFVYRPMPASLPAGGEVILTWPSDKIEIYKSIDDFRQNGTPLISPQTIKVSDFPQVQNPHLPYVLNPIKESSVGKDILVCTSYKCPDGTVVEDKIRITVIGVGKVEWIAKDSPLDKNENPGGGLRIFPDKNEASDTADRSKVIVKATISPKIKDIPVYLKIFDVDDPSSDKAPVDDEDDQRLLGY